MNLACKKSPSNLGQDCVATIGVFDGVHLGHRYILGRLKQEAEKRKKPALVISFDFPPEKSFLPQEKFSGYLTDYKQKISLIESLGINYIWILEADKDLFSLEAFEFLSYVNARFPINLLLVGNDFRFGAGVGAGIKELTDFSRRGFFDLKIIKKKKFKKVTVSSSFLKKLIREARLKEVKNFLGRNYTVKGRVVTGKGVGRRLGFPTANLDTFAYVLPSEGVYAAYTRVDGKNFLSAVNIGKGSFESHLLGFSKNIVNRVVEVDLLEKLRGELHFQTQDKLAQFIKKDIQFITSKYSIPAL